MSIKVFTLRTALLYVLLIGAIVISLVGYFSRESVSNNRQEILLLVSDTVTKDDSRVSVWKDAAAEEGIPLEILHASEYLRPWMDRTRYVGIILPDLAHTSVSEALYHELKDYVERGGQLFLVYDAGTKTQHNAYRVGKSIFSDLIGIDYALYDRLRDKTMDTGIIQGTSRNMDLLNIPVGKYAPSTPVHGSAHPFQKEHHQRSEKLYTISGYEYAEFRYPSFVTGTVYQGKALLVSPVTGLVAGYRPYGNGEVLFVNLPLGYLKGQTDGVFLHGFLRYFADRLLALPTMATVPEGIGGLIMNWHVDSNAALKPIEQIEALGIYDQGPYSIHITAGPDTRKFNDKVGLNVPKNPSFQKWIRDELKRGNVIGSHGGWIHDYFGLNVKENNQKDFEKFLDLNHQALTDASGVPMLEYSAPMGNQPEWITSWLEDKGYLAYYFTGNTGMGPTRSYRDGRLKHRRIWSFPILNYKVAASFEEMKQEKFSSEEVSRWLTEVTDFTVRHRVARLVYFHPPGMMLYPEAMRQWLKHTAELKRQNQAYRWYTMKDLAQFLNEREQVTWSINREKQTWNITAAHPRDLTRQTWFFPKSTYRRPTIIQGDARVVESDDRWLVVAKSGKSLQFSSERVTNQ